MVKIVVILALVACSALAMPVVTEENELDVNVAPFEPTEEEEMAEKPAAATETEPGMTKREAMVGTDMEEEMTAESPEPYAEEDMAENPTSASATETETEPEITKREAMDDSYTEKDAAKGEESDMTPVMVEPADMEEFEEMVEEDLIDAEGRPTVEKIEIVPATNEFRAEQEESDDAAVITEPIVRPDEDESAEGVVDEMDDADFRSDAVEPDTEEVIENEDDMKKEVGDAFDMTDKDRAESVEGEEAPAAGETEEEDKMLMIKPFEGMDEEVEGVEVSAEVKFTIPEDMLNGEAQNEAENPSEGAVEA